jgi:hypothetical protein
MLRDFDNDLVILPNSPCLPPSLPPSFPASLLPSFLRSPIALPLIGTRGSSSRLHDTDRVYSQVTKPVSQRDIPSQIKENRVTHMSQ